MQDGADKLQAKSWYSVHASADRNIISLINQSDFWIRKGNSR